MLTRLPPTDCKTIHKSYTMKQKRTTFHLIEAVVDAEIGISSVCRSINIKCGLFYQWKEVVRGESNLHLKKLGIA